MLPSRRSNRIASLQQSRQPPAASPAAEDVGDAAEFLVPPERPVCARKRRRKQGQPSCSSKQSSYTAIADSRFLLVSASELAVPAQTCNSLKCFLVCFDCRFVTTRLRTYLSHVASCNSQLLPDASPSDTRLYRCIQCQCGWVTNCPELLPEHLADVHFKNGAATTASVGNNDEVELFANGVLGAVSEAGCPGDCAPSLPTDAASDDQSPLLLGRAATSGQPRLSQRQLPHACPDCGKRFGMRYRLMRHRLAIHQAAATSATGTSGGRRRQKLSLGGGGAPGQALKKAEVQPTNGAGATLGRLACRICCKLFKSRSSYLVHKLAFHTPASAGSAIPPPPEAAAMATAGVANDADCLVVTDPEPFKCRYCDRKFSQKTAFARHQAHDHPLERPYVCRECGRGFKFQHSRAMHERMHRGELTCRQCQRVFHSDREYNEHVASVHEGSLTFLCESCGRTFPTQYKLSRHGRVHNRSRQHACPDCGRHFHRMDKLKLHQQCVHSTDRPHLCHLCGRTFNRRDKLAVHVKQHSEYRCQTCPAAFPSQTELRRHISTVHLPADAARPRPSATKTKTTTTRLSGASCVPRRRGRAKAPVAVDVVNEAALTLTESAMVVGPPPQVDLLPPHHNQQVVPAAPSPLGDALITIATGGGGIGGGDLLHQHQQIIFLEAYDQHLQHHQPEQQELHHQFPHHSATLTLYSPMSGTYYSTSSALATATVDPVAVEVALADVLQ